MKALLTFAPLFRDHARAFALALLLSLVTLVAGVALLGTSGWFITATALTTAGLGFNLFVPSAAVRGLSFVRILARYGERLIGHDATLKLLSGLRGWLFAKLFPRLPLPDRSLRHGDLVSRLTADVDALDTAFLVAIGPLVAALIVGGAMTTVLAFVLPAAALPYAIAMAVATIGVPLAMMGLSRRAGRASVAAQADLRTAVLDGVNGHTDLVLLGRLGTAATDFGDSTALAARLRGRLGLVTTSAGFVVQALAATTLIVTLWSGVVALEAGQVDGPLMAGLLLAVLASFEATGLVVRSTGKATSAMAAAERLVALADLPPPVIEPGLALAFPKHAPIILEDVCYAYPGTPPVLDGLSLHLKPGDRVAITGPSGGGKSTLLRLLLRLADPGAGTIRIGETPLSRVASADIHRNIALLSQDSPVFIDTIRNNLLLARPEATDDQLWASLEQAQLADHIRTLPQGIDTIVGEAGRTLSAGQARRLCLARALVADAPVLLLDEPTNALDAETERAFFATLSAATRNRTFVLVTHAAIPSGTVDRVFRLEHGRLTEA